MNIFNALLDLVYPSSCMVCGGFSRTYLCDECRASIRLQTVKNCCSVCGKVFMDIRSAGLVAGVCPECQKHPPRYDMGRSAAAFGGVVRSMIHGLKYSRAVWLRDDLVDLLHGCVLGNYSHERIDAICPVPLNPVKARIRGYNQAGVLAAELSKRMNVPYLEEILVRTRHTPSQTLLNAEQRRENMDGAFESPVETRPYVYGRCILLIDDVMTTGSTLSECAGMLKRNGAERVLCATLARD